MKKYYQNPPCFNIDIMEGAVQHMLQICGVLSEEAIVEFCKRFAYARKRELKEEYIRTTFLHRMLTERKIFQASLHSYTLNPLLKVNPKGQAAFWVFIENMTGVDIKDVMSGPSPAQITYIKNNRIYQIVVCEGDGRAEQGKLLVLHESMKQHRKSQKEAEDSTRYILVFSSKENMEASPFNMPAPTLNCIINYSDGARVPSLFFKMADK